MIEIKVEGKVEKIDFKEIKVIVDSIIHLEKDEVVSVEVDSPLYLNYEEKDRIKSYEEFKVNEKKTLKQIEVIYKEGEKVIINPIFES